MKTLWALLVLLAGCSTSYFPRPGPGIKVSMKNGSPTFWKQGKVVQQGIFGSDLASAMTDVPEASEHARTWRSRNIWGLVVSLTGAAVLTTGSALLRPGEGLSGQNAAGISLLGGGLAAAITGVILTITGQAHLWDALNMYNDKVRGQ